MTADRGFDHGPRTTQILLTALDRGPRAMTAGLLGYLLAQTLAQQDTHLLGITALIIAAKFEEEEQVEEEARRLWDNDNEIPLNWT